MSILSLLGKIGAIGAAPFTGGASLSALPIIDGIASLGGTLGAGAAASANGRRGDAALNTRINSDNARNQLEANTFNLKAPEARTNQAAHGDVLAHMQDTPLTGDPRIDKFAGGGLRPSAFGATSRAAGDTASRQALQALMSGSDQLHPVPTRIENPGTMEKIGGVGGILGALAGSLPIRQPPVNYGSAGPFAGGYQMPTMKIPGSLYDDEQDPRNNPAMAGG